MKTEVAIVGGGPSGAICGERLAEAGFRVTIFDEHLAWEKPCGGGLTYKAIEKYPFLMDGPYPKKIVRNVELVSSGGHRAWLDLDRPIVIYSRKVLNGLLLERAERAGCKVVCARVTDVDVAGTEVRLAHTEGEQACGFVVLAAGARNRLLPETTPLGKQDLEQTMGYFIPGEHNSITVKFLRNFEGYLWSFPRADHLSVGICGAMSKHDSRELRQNLEEFLLEEELGVSGARFYSHVLPSPQVETLRGRRVVGRNWALVGDAAAWVDPITGEGLHYALRSGDLLGQALAAGEPESYPERVRAEFGADLIFATRIARLFYKGRFLGGAVATRMIQFIRRSATFRELMRDVFSGAQDYHSLKRRLWAQLGITLSEMVGSLLWPLPAYPEAEKANTPR